ncbi:hypothetical protein [Flammeovirga aprica]|uniref:Nuclear transport factor 2 family protein n=1 Tax=Flammeovirga aprica JL-4 TaxID=694437 RepID=A0A7X9XC44_9BACT|nr:hypothetical protein [Flammeovirga aprica]NME71365.1 hypothetical protein [Flammeovirga aprica JL-4]
MMKALSNILIALILGLFAIQSSFAQSKKDVEKLIENAVENRRSKNPVAELHQAMDNFSESAIINMTYVSMDEKKHKKVLKKTEYQTIYENMYKENIRRDYELEVHDIQVRKNTAVAVFSLDYTLINNANGKVMSKGTEFIVSTLIAKESAWKFLELNITDVESEKYQGTCSCEVLSNDKTGNVVARVVSPKGDHFQRDVHSVYRKKVKGRDLFMVQGVKFEWTENLEVYVLDQDLKPLHLLDNAKNHEQVVQKIIAYLYKDECFGLKVQ